MPNLDHNAIDDALQALAQTADQLLGGCGFELWTARTNLAALDAACRFTGADRDAFLERAGALGLYDPSADAAWLLDETAETCGHGIEWGFCPAGCGSPD